MMPTPSRQIMETFQRQVSDMVEWNEILGTKMIMLCALYSITISVDQLRLKLLLGLYFLLELRFGLRLLIVN